MNVLQSFEASVTVHPATQRRVLDHLNRQQNLYANRNYRQNKSAVWGTQVS